MWGNSGRPEQVVKPERIKSFKGRTSQRHPQSDTYGTLTKPPPMNAEA